jgi:hypothetical protein
MGHSLADPAREVIAPGPPFAAAGSAVPGVRGHHGTAAERRREMREPERKTTPRKVAGGALCTTSGA